MKRFVFPILIGILMVAIFCLSAQIADDSKITSDRFCRLAARLIFSDYKSWDAATQKSVVKGLSFVVRKAAHFSEYALMGFLWYIWLRHVRFNFLISLAATAFYAMTDEFHQLFVPGRSGEIRDVLVDSAGGLCGIVVAFVLLCIIHCISHKDIVSYGTWRKSEWKQS